MRSALAEVDASGRFARSPSTFREIINSDHPLYQPDTERYHLYISLACPWANRCLTVLHIKGLQECISVSVVHPTWQKSRPDETEDGHYGWAFADSGESFKAPCGTGEFVCSGCTVDSVNGCKTIRQIYELSTTGFNGTKYTVPVLWDKKTRAIVNNESSDIVRMLNSAFASFTTGPNKALDLYPTALRAEIDTINEWVYDGINNGVYKCGFAKSQTAYNDAVAQLYDKLELVEDILTTKRYLLGASFTEADVRLIMTLFRFDEVYVVYFKCNKKRIADYPNISGYCRDVYQSFCAGTVNMEHIKTHYFTSHAQLNAHAIIPVGSDSFADFLLPHDRGSKFS